MVGVPATFIPVMRVMPGVWSKLTAAAHTVPYQFAILGNPGAKTRLLPDQQHNLAAKAIAPVLAEFFAS